MIALPGQTFETVTATQTTTAPLADVVVVYPNQSLVDLVLQEDGSPFALAEWAFANSINPTDAIVPGTKIKTQHSTQRKLQVINHFKGKSLIVATVKPVYAPDINPLDYVFPFVIPIV